MNIADFYYNLDYNTTLEKMAAASEEEIKGTSDFLDKAFKLKDFNHDWRDEKIILPVGVGVSALSAVPGVTYEE